MAAPARELSDSTTIQSRIPSASFYRTKATNKERLCDTDLSAAFDYVRNQFALFRQACNDVTMSFNERQRVRVHPSFHAKRLLRE